MRTLGRAAGAAIAAALLAGCTNAAVDHAVGTADGSSQLVLSRSDSAIVIQNATGRPLLNVRIDIDPGTGAAFFHVLPTIDAGVRREVPFADFRNEDGALFDPGYFAPKQVKAAARDTLGNSYDVALPWAQ